MVDMERRKGSWAYILMHAVLEFSADFQTCRIEDCRIKKSKMCAFSYLPLAKISYQFSKARPFVMRF